MFDNLEKSIEALSCSEAKNLLLNALIRINQLKESGGTQEQTIDYMYKLYDRVISYHQHGKLFDREYEAVHLVCGESSAGALRVGLGRKNLIIGFPDFFAIGPLFKLHVEEGWNNRYEWLKDHINVPNNYIEEEYPAKFLNTLGKINAIPDKLPIIVWSAENANEQIGIRYFIQLLKGKTNKIIRINATRGVQKPHTDHLYQHTGGFRPENLYQIYTSHELDPLSEEERGKLQDEWETLAKTKETLRIWDGQSIKSVTEDFYDEHILAAVRELHKKQGTKDFIRAARIIGQTLILVGGNVTDAFLEYRIRALVYKGLFDIKGIPKSMRHYSVKLKD